MCEKTTYKTSNPRIDKCMRKAISTLNQLMYETRHQIVACCCGHKKYPMTILIKIHGEVYELFSNMDIPRTRNFYKRDKDGYYYIPEVNRL